MQPPVQHTYTAEQVADILGVIIPRLTPHELRHTFSTTLYDSGIPAFDVQKVMGHDKLDVTSIYIHGSVATMRKILKYD